MRLAVIRSLLILAVAATPAQDAPEAPRLRDQIADGLRSSFAFPWHELMAKENGSEWRNLLTGFSGSVAYSYPLKTSPAAAANGLRDQGDRESHLETLTASVSYRLLGSWFAGMTAYRYLHSGLQAPWNPDFTYGFGYFDWHPGTISVQYNNYSGNRFPGRTRGAGTGRFQDGSLSISCSWAY